MDITAHLMAAIDNEACALNRLADAAEDVVAHLTHQRTLPQQTSRFSPVSQIRRARGSKQSRHNGENRNKIVNG